MKHGVDISLVKSLGSKSPGLKRPLTFYQYNISMEAKGGKERLNIANVMNDFQIILISNFDLSLVVFFIIIFFICSFKCERHRIEYLKSTREPNSKDQKLSVSICTQ